MHEPRTYQAQLATASARLNSAGIDGPAREARHLMQHVCKLTATGLINAETRPMAQHESEAFFDLIERRASGEPYEYLTGEAWFYGLPFYCSHDTLIPRQDSQVVVDEALARLPLGASSLIADLGTGTGCLLVALMKNHPGIHALGVERSPDAAAIARTNIERHGLQARARIEERSWENIADWSTFGLVISNPPYIASKVIDTLDPSVKAFEPHEALDGGEDGLDAYRSLISLAAAKLNGGAWLVLEIGFDQRQAVSALLEEAGFKDIASAHDTGLRDRVISARR
jgi:release factor glutamine methyltransferase